MLSARKPLSKMQDINAESTFALQTIESIDCLYTTGDPSKLIIVCVHNVVLILWLGKRAVPGGLLHTSETPASLTGLEAVCMLCDPRRRQHSADHHASICGSKHATLLGPLDSEGLHASHGCASGHVAAWLCRSWRAPGLHVRREALCAGVAE